VIAQPNLLSLVKGEILKLMESNDQREAEKMHCNKCMHETAHSKLFSITPEQYQEERYGCTLWGSITYTLLQCLGCNSIVLKRFELHSESHDGIDYYPDIECYPERAYRSMPKWQKDLPDDMRELMDEIYKALHSKNRRLALMGIRTLVDMFCNYKLNDPRTFQEKLKELVSNNYLIDDEHEKTLEIAINAGSAAAHRAYKPTKESLEITLDIVENFLELNLLHVRRDFLAKETPERKRNK
jgi:hypothetical protein